MQEKTPKYLYKVLSVENWKESQSKESVKLSSDDSEYIHFAREDQLDKIVDKYWGHQAQCVILKIDTEKLLGQIVLEANPGGINKYYHLYEGSIPMSAVLESRCIQRK